MSLDRAFTTEAAATLAHRGTQRTESGYKFSRDLRVKAVRQLSGHENITIVERKLVFSEGFTKSHSSVYNYSVYNYSVYNYSVYNYSVYNYSVYNYSVYNYSVYNYSVYNYSVYNYSVYNYSVYNYSVYNYSVYNYSVYNDSGGGRYKKWCDDFDRRCEGQHANTVLRVYHYGDASLLCLMVTV